ncbi:DUF2059 domain-containing protein [Helicobacter sp. MIT 14-3879]|uniref:DUF2059 domain-containing protein n=1 Tax=Helicobacter sp. MIT 14-3879 TaxID=2040649 RepID=UPI000E1EC662|nr:DUF2059 domain-containing protein [Helicobacter sp. MIT 14-3879]RDU65445.1 hypothetical protein CQA44_00170 [Helicobacter sp. MIT 14-3879]
MKKIFILFLLLISLLFSDYKDAYEDFLELSGYNASYKLMFDDRTILKVIHSELSTLGINITDEMEDDLTAILKNYMFDVKEELDKDMFSFYKENYSEDDLKALIEFYKTDIGKKVSSLTPLFEKKLLDTLDKVKAKYYPEMEQEIIKLFGK